ncbi:hypothetical protein B0J17DRAFT_705989 [Rhizoctonia solani]|nr:hypothetical protein B0J17DRAFT_705989 [Rhizoctonia solani]
MARDAAIVHRYIYPWLDLGVYTSDPTAILLASHSHSLIMKLLALLIAAPHLVLATYGQCTGTIEVLGGQGRLKICGNDIQAVFINAGIQLIRTPQDGSGCARVNGDQGALSVIWGQARNLWWAYLSRYCQETRFGSLAACGGSLTIQDTEGRIKVCGEAVSLFINAGVQLVHPPQDASDCWYGKICG